MDAFASRDLLGTGELTGSVEVQGQMPVSLEQYSEDLITGDSGPSAVFNAERVLAIAGGVCMSKEF